MNLFIQQVASLRSGLAASRHLLRRTAYTKQRNLLTNQTLTHIPNSTIHSKSVTYVFR